MMERKCKKISWNKKKIDRWKKKHKLEIKENNLELIVSL